MALEGIPSAGSAPTSGASISPGSAAAAPSAPAGPAGGRPAAAGSAAGAKTSGPSNAAGASGASTASSTDPNATPSDFTTVLAGALNAVAPATASAAADEPKIAAKTADDDVADDEIGFEDLSEFLAQVLVPAGSNPAAPSASADSEATVEIDFMQDDNGGLSSQIVPALPADARGKAALSAAQDRFATSMATADLALAADASALKDALVASEKAVAAALDPSSVAPTADLGGDANGLNAAAGFSPLHAAALHASHSTAHATLQAEVRSPMGTQAWADEVGGHLTWMASHGRESASLTLTPEHLGPIEVRITTQDGQTSVWFGAQNADTRSAIEQALPRLRELFSSQGLSLADSGVFREAPRQQPQNFSDAANGSSNGEAASVVTSVAKRGNGILDLYA